MGSIFRLMIGIRKLKTAPDTWPNRLVFVSFPFRHAKIRRNSRSPFLLASYLKDLNPSVAVLLALNPKNNLGQRAARSVTMPITLAAKNSNPKLLNRVDFSSQMLTEVDVHDIRAPSSYIRSDKVFTHKKVNRNYCVVL